MELAFGGDLQAQCTASNYTMRALGAPYVGLYGACSTMAEGLALAACTAAAGFAGQVLAFTSSHFCAAVSGSSAPPLDYGGKRTTTAQWTAHRRRSLHPVAGRGGGGRGDGAQRDFRPGAGL